MVVLGMGFVDLKLDVPMQMCNGTASDTAGVRISIDRDFKVALLRG